MLRKRGGATLPCPECSGRTRVMETRRTDEKTITRVRLCKTRKCGLRFTSEERYAKKRR
jgi:transcriptional regulator NrdR family protein